MGTVKEHHTLPRFYLKSFASDADREARAVGLYVIPRNVLHPRASIKDQCSEAWFYGRDGVIEKSLSKLENDWAPMVRALSGDVSLVQAASSYARRDLINFIVVQMLRTKRAAINTKQVWDLGMGLVAERTPNHLPPPGYDLRSSVEEASAIAMEQAADVADALDDMGIGLLSSPAMSEFLTSDNPVFKYNLYCEGVRTAGTTGALSRGLLLFMPVSPRISVLLYDRKVYKFRGAGLRAAAICSTADVDALNGMQFVGADTSLYFSGNLTAAYFENLSLHFTHARGEIGIRAVEAEEESDSRRTLIHSYEHIPNLHLKLSFLSVMRRARRIPQVRRVYSRRNVPTVEPATPDTVSEVVKYVPRRKRSAPPRRSTSS